MPEKYYYNVKKLYLFYIRYQIQAMKKIFFLYLLFFLIRIDAQVVSAGTPQAMKATGGNGMHKSRIWWVNWDLNNDKISNDNLVNGATTTFNSPAGFRYVITISNVRVYNSSGVEITSGTNYVLGANTATSWSGNNFPFAYTTFKNMSTGATVNPAIITTDNLLGSIGDGNRVTFRLTVTATDPSGATGNATGIVIGGSESLNGTGEWYTLKMPQGKIRVIDKYIYNNNWTNYSVQLQISNSGKTIKATNAGGGDRRGDVMLFAEDVPYIDCEVKGGGGQSIAIGFLEELDYSDAPQSYGMAFHLFENKFIGGLFPDGDHNLNTNSNTVDLASSTGQLAKFFDPTLRLGPNIDSEDNPFSSLPATGGAAPDWDDTHGDPVTDEAALNTQTATTNGYVSIAYVNISPLTSYLSLWVDKDRNGTYDNNEKLTQTIPANKSGNVILDLSPLNIPLGNNYYTRIRYSSQANLGPTGYAPDGEVEDHWINVVNNIFNILGTVYQDNNGGTPDGISFYNLTVELYNSSNVLIATTQTNFDGQYMFTGLSNGTYTVKVVLPSSSYQNVSSTDTTPTNGSTTVTVNNANVTGVDFGLYFAVCYKNPPITTGGLPTNHGITALGRAGDDGDGNVTNDWPMIRKGGRTVLEAKTKGFVINRVAANFEPPLDDGQVPTIANPVKGMIIYDTTNNCLKIYDGTSWKCFAKQGCPTVN